MGWFDDLIQERKRKNQEIFESSFNSISQNVFGDKAEEKDFNRDIFDSVLKHYHIDRVYIPDKINDLASDLDQVLSRYNLLTHKITLEGSWQRDNSEPIIAFTKVNKTPVLLFHKGNNYYYIHPQSKKKALVTSSIAEKLDENAISFYRPLPRRKLTLKDYFAYIRKCVRPIDIIVVILLVAVVVGVGMINPYLTKIMMGKVIIEQNFSLFWSTALFMFIVSLSTLLIKATQAIINMRVSIRIENSVHSAFMMRLLALPTSFFKKYNTGELNSRISGVSALCSLIINGVFVAGLSSIASLLYLIQINDFAPSLILPSLLVIVINLAFNILTSFVERNVMSKQTKLTAKERGVSYDLINGMQKIRLSGSEKRAFGKWADIYSKDARLQYNPPFIVKIAPVISALIAVGGNIFIYLLVIKNNIDTSTYVAFNTSYAMLSAALLASSTVLNNTVKIRPLLEMIKPILEEEEENNGEKLAIDSLKGNIKLDHVSFKYDDEPELTLKDLCLDIKEGEYVAIVGKTGCGKSTIVRLLLGFEKPLSGHVYYDGHDIEELDLSSLRRKIGSVTQNGSLFHADIYHNIVISAPELGEKEAWEAARVAQIAKDIEEMPMGMNTVISEGQGSISGGQKQRIMIARAIVHKPKIIIFDEATSSLDNKIQKDVTAAIGKLKCTRLIVAHRLSTIKDCDRILYLENGRIVEEGKYDELIALNGKFKELIERQKVD